LSSAFRPAIHILAGEKVCIQSTRPTHARDALASVTRPSTSSGVFTTGLKTTRQGMRGERSRASAIVREFVATCCSVSGP
jgi:hypothetical protein